MESPISNTFIDIGLSAAQMYKNFKNALTFIYMLL